MLSSDEDSRVRSYFNVYEHNWSFYEELLGDCRLLGDVLCFCDGHGLYLPAFSLSRFGHTFERDEIFDCLKRAESQYPRADLKFLNVWGKFVDLPGSYNLLNGEELYLCEQSDYFEEAFDSVFDVAEFNAFPSATGKRRIRALGNKKFESRILESTQFTHEHLQLMEEWFSFHTVSVVHKEFFYILRSYVQKRAVFLCEIRTDGVLVGLSVIAIVSSDRMVVLNSFPMRGGGLRAGDALFFEAIKFANKHSLRWIHRGYSATPSLLRTKESWGATSRGSPYREAFFAIDKKYEEMIAEGRFLWRLRMSN